MRTLKRHIILSCLAAALFLPVGGIAFAAGINDVAAPGPPAARASSAKKLALKKHRAMLRRFIRFLGQRITVDMGDDQKPTRETTRTPDGTAPAALAPLQRSIPLGAVAGARPLDTGTRLSVNSHRIRLIFQLRW